MEREKKTNNNNNNDGRRAFPKPKKFANFNYCALEIKKKLS